MAPRNLRSISILALVFALLVALMPFSSAQALAVSPALPALDKFVVQVKNGQPDVLRGVYVPEILAATIVQQPEGHFEFVSPRNNILTQFGLASQFGATGLLAHNYLAGASFSQFQPGQVIYLVYGDGRTASFMIKEVLSYQALDPLSTTSDFVDLKTNKRVSASSLMNKVYNRPGQVIFQTCIERDNNKSWGRLFVIAEPYTQN